MPLITDPDNLALAYWRARRGKEGKQEVQEYVRDLQQNLLEMQQALQTGRVKTGEYRHFVIHDPKERTICAAPFEQRVLHHALMNVCGPLFDRRQTDDSFASRKGKGTYAALACARVLHRRYRWCVKMDVRKYFDNIVHVILKKQLSCFFKEPLLLGIYFDIIDSYEVSPGRGLPIGNLTSQYFANHYLCGLDHFVREELRTAGYVRYMDDMLIYGNDRDTLLRQAHAARLYMEERLGLVLKVFNVSSTVQTMQFLGYRLTRGPLLLGRRSMRRYRLKLKAYYRLYDAGGWSEAVLQRHLSPLVSFVAKADCRHFCVQTLKESI